MIMDFKFLYPFFMVLVFRRGICGKGLATSWDLDNCLICFSHLDTFFPVTDRATSASKMTQSSGLCADYVTLRVASVFYLENEHLRLWLISSSVSYISAPTLVDGG